MKSQLVVPSLDTSVVNGQKTSVMALLRSYRVLGLLTAVAGGCLGGCSGMASRPPDAASGAIEESGGGANAEAGSPLSNPDEDGIDSGAGAVDTSGLDGLRGPIPLPAKLVGNIDTRGSIRSDFSTFWNQYTPENAGKWGSVERTRGTFNWTRLDASYQYCNDHGIVFKQHNFVWGSQQPSWTADLTSDDGPAVVQTWMREFCARYPNTKLIDVVNEPPPHTTPAYMDAIGGAGSSGWDWIINAFTWARQACPNALLILNDFNNVEYSSDAQHTIDIVNVLRRAGAPVDAVGCQAHGTVDVSAATLKANIDKIAFETGLPVYITEYDLDVADDAKQAAVMQEQFTMFWQNEKIRGITLWGYVFGSTWLPNTGLILSDGTPRPAMSWLVSFLGR
jgi:endo-1,4-beta-xylanase